MVNFLVEGVLMGLSEEKARQEYQKYYKEEYSEYTRGFHDGKREIFTKVRYYAIFFGFLLFILSPLIFAGAYVAIGIIVGCLRFKQSDGLRVMARMGDTLYSASVWPYSIWRDAMAQCSPAPWVKAHIDGLNAK